MRSRNDPRCLPSNKDLRPATPFRAPGSGHSRRCGLATASPVLYVFSPARHPRGCSNELGPRSRAPCQGLTRLSWALDAACRLLQPVTTHGHTLRATDPRTRAELSPRCSPAPTDAGCVGPRCVAASRTSEPRSARNGLHHRVPLAWTSRTAGRSAGVKASRALFERCARALLFDASDTRVTGSILREVWSPSRFIAPAETHLGNRLAKGDLFGRIRVPSSATEPLRDRRGGPLRARQDRCPVTPPRERHCSGALSRLCYPFCTAPL